MAAKLTRMTHKIAIQLHLVAESCTICSSRSRRSVRKVLDTPSYQRVYESAPQGIGVDEGIILKLIFEKQVVRIWTGFIWPRIGFSGGLLWTR
jgi:hypothetical protein